VIHVAKPPDIVNGTLLKVESKPILNVREKLFHV
jgi:hypothetical protein